MVPGVPLAPEHPEPDPQVRRRGKDCVAKGPCTVAEATGSPTASAEGARDVLDKHGSGSRSSCGARSRTSSLTTLGAVQRKVYLGGVVQPLLAETEARMGVARLGRLHADYQAVLRRPSRRCLDWRAAKKPPLPDGPVLTAGGPALLAARRLRAQDARESKAATKSAEIDAWIAGPLGPSDAGPDREPRGRAAGADSRLDIAVPDPERPIAEVRGVLDGREPRALGLHAHGRPRSSYADLYTQMTTLPKSAPPDYLGALRRGRDRSSRRTTTRRPSTWRRRSPGEKGFPGATLEQWKSALRTDYQTLLKWKPIAPGRISERRTRGEEILARHGHGPRDARSPRQAELAVPARRRRPPKPAWSKPASTLGGRAQRPDELRRPDGLRRHRRRQARSTARRR